MSWLDMVPGVSQVKASLQYVTGDKEGAKQTIDRFATKTPVISHITAGVLKVCGEDEKAKECWSGANSSLNALPVVGHVKAAGHYLSGDREGGDRAKESANRTTSGMINSTPAVGHIKGLVHYARDEIEEGDEAMIAASRTTTVMAAGAGGFLLGGPPGAIAAGMGAGAEWDLGTAIVTDGKKMDGICRIIKDPTKVDSYFDAGLSLAGDAMTGYSGGKLAERVVRNSEIRTTNNLRTTRENKAFQSDKTVAPKNTKEIYCEVTDTKTGKTYTGVNESVRQRYGDPATRPNEFLTKYPDIEAPLKRHPASCAESQALHKLVTDSQNPNPSTLNTRMTTLEVRPNGEIYNMPRCENCIAYKDVVGTCTTDYTVSHFSFNH